MDANTTTRIATKAMQSLGKLESAQHQGRVLAEQPVPAKAEDWARFANDVAKAEGQAHAWNRVQMTVAYFERKGMELTDAAILDTVVELLTAGADDSWSGRTNDVQRARFDGVREACTAIKYLVIAD